MLIILYSMMQLEGINLLIGLGEEKIRNISDFQFQTGILSVYILFHIFLLNKRAYIVHRTTIVSEIRYSPTLTTVNN